MEKPIVLNEENMAEDMETAVFSDPEVDHHYEEQQRNKTAYKHKSSKAVVPTPQYISMTMPMISSGPSPANSTVTPRGNRDLRIDIE